ncbi:MAG: AAA family ATPase [Lachnospiraceae bacterium]|jgi:DNA helicase-2/ATP-dependent DNA helicase PcrA|nr:AAA family ATPase [Lachnospiraceae bacterium]
MTDQHSERILEETHLREILEEAERQLKQAHEAVERKETELQELKREIRENTEHGAADLSTTDGFEALVELNQSIAPVTNLVADYDETMRKIHRLNNLIKCPYFARIDFCFEGEEIPEQIYIGKTSLTGEKAVEIYVYDWRSPIASVFYRFMTEEAFYDAPAGRITGRVELKRQYEIRDSRLLYFFDTDRSINDEILKQLLSKNTSPKMKTIVETIQKEQDIVIRNLESDLLMIQGVAGSGKTSIALHRAAYLMYQGLQSRLAANNILILSPNSTFEQYISEVLPELGEENAVSMVFEDILRSLLGEKVMWKAAPGQEESGNGQTGVGRIQTQREFLENAVANGAWGDYMKKSMRYKTSEAFLGLLDRFAEQIPLRQMAFQDVYHEGNRIAEKEELRRRAMQRPETPLAVRLEQLTARVLEDAFGNRKGAGEEKARVLEEIQRFTRLNLYELYKSFWSDETNFQGADSQGVEELEEIRSGTLENLEGDCLYFDDAVPVLYLYLKLHGCNDYRNIRQVIIDEAQDYYPLQFEILRILFPNARYTVLGDINQTLSKQEDGSFYEQVRRILKKKKSSLVTLNKSFRCTNEILQFSLQFIQEKPQIESFNRSGEAVEVRAFRTRRDYLAGILKEMENCKEKGYGTICLLCKTEEGCQRLFRELGSRAELRMAGDDGVEGLKGCFILPSYMAKGLEFDAVLICDGDSDTYQTGDDRKLLYIECTRALHRLSLFCQGELTPLLEMN